MGVTLLPGAQQKVVKVFGDDYRFVQVGEQTGGAYSVFEISANPGSGVPPHTHEKEDESFFILEGQLEVTDASGTYVAGPGDSVYLPKGQTHSWKVSDSGPARFHLATIPAGMESMFSELAAIPPGPPDLSEVLPICERYGITFVPPAD